MRPVTTASSWAKAKLSFDPINIKEAGYIFVYLSYENQSNNWVHFDDLKVTHTKSRIVQYNEYYPFGLQTTNSWTRENTTGNNYLGNGGTELNQTSQLYELDFRNYDPILGRMNGVDPMASKYSSLTPYNYSFNDPVTFNDPNGADPYDHYSGGSGYYFSGGYYTYDDVARNPDNMGEFHSAFGSRDSYSMGFLAAAMGYGRMSSWQGSTFAGVSLPYNAQMRQHARAVRNDEMSVEEYGARYGSSMGGGLGGLTNAMLYLGAVQYDGGTFTYKFGNKTYGGTYHTENGAVTSTATGLVIQSASGGWVQIGAMKVSEFAPRRKAQFGGSSVVTSENGIGFDFDLAGKVDVVASSILGIGKEGFTITSNQVKDSKYWLESAKNTTKAVANNLRRVGYAGAIIGTGISFIEALQNPSKYSLWASFGTNFVITATGFIPYVGLPLAIGLSSYEAAGGFNNFYASFDDPVTRALYLQGLVFNNPFMFTGNTFK